jgi:hypothetical protein
MAVCQDLAVSDDLVPVLRAYQPGDLPAVQRMWREVGWIDDSDGEAEGLETFLGVGHAEVAEVDGEAECLAHWVEGSLRHVDTDLPLCAVTAVTTSLVGRQGGLASRLTARAVAAGAEAGAAVAALGMFDQGFYDRLGFGSGPYEHKLTVDPARLDVPVPYRRPLRLTADDADEVHAALAGRVRSHGGIVLDPPPLMAAEMAWTEHLVALGYRDDDGVLTHCLVGSLHDDHGPLVVDVLAYRTTQQLLELLRALQALADQVNTVTLLEPPELQLIDLVRQPLRERRRGRDQPVHGFRLESIPWWQARIVDLDRCMAALRAIGPPVRCNLSLHDPVADHLDGDGWSGLSGELTLTVDDPSSVVPGHTAGLPVLRASVGALSRWWLGVGSASQLAATDALEAPPELLDALDRAVRLPRPVAGWDY